MPAPAPLPVLLEAELSTEDEAEPAQRPHRSRSARRPRRPRRSSRELRVRETAMQAPSCLLPLLMLQGPAADEELTQWVKAAALPGELSDDELRELLGWLRRQARDTIYGMAFEELQELRGSLALLGKDVRHALSFAARCERSLRDEGSAVEPLQ